MNSKVSAMMKANPKLQVNSGRRDEVITTRLKARGHSRVSGKSSAHTRGLAADLGPRSEYGWIVANAHKFGLKSGVGHGEPWHVGMPGIGDIDIGESPSNRDPRRPRLQCDDAHHAYHRATTGGRTRVVRYSIRLHRVSGPRRPAQSLRRRAGRCRPGRWVG